MLKQGFKEDVERIMNTIKETRKNNLQVLLFSATVPFWVKQVAKEQMAPDFEMVDLA